MSVARYDGFRSAVGWARVVAGKISGSVSPIRADIVARVDRLNEEMATGLDTILRDL